MLVSQNSEMMLLLASADEALEALPGFAGRIERLRRAIGRSHYIAKQRAMPPIVKALLPHLDIAVLLQHLSAAHAGVVSDHLVGVLGVHRSPNDEW